MLVEQLIEHPEGTLSFHEQHLCCYSPFKGVVINNGVCIVSPSLNKVNCNFAGVLKRISGVLYRRIYQYITYDTIVFLSKVSMKLSSINNGYIKKVYFFADVDLEIDIDTKELNHSLVFGVPDDENSNIIKFCKEYNMQHEVVFSNRSILFRSTK